MTEAVYTFPDVGVGDMVLFAVGPESEDWAPMLVTGVNHVTTELPVLDSNGKPKISDAGKPVKISYTEKRSLRGVVTTHTGGAMQTGMSNVYDSEGPAIRANKDLWQAIAVSTTQGVFKLTESQNRLAATRAMVNGLFAEVTRMAQKAGKPRELANGSP